MKRNIHATRLGVFPVNAEAKLEVAGLLKAIGEVWPADGPQVFLNLASEALLADLLVAKPAKNLLIEVPAFMAGEPAMAAAMRAAHENGNALLLKGRPLQPLPREVLPYFKHVIVDLSDERRIDSAVPLGVTRTITVVQSGVNNVADMEKSFARGSVAVLGWPIDDAVTQAAGKGIGKVPSNVQLIAQLMRQVDAEDSTENLEATLKRDPALAFQLLRLINSPALGLKVEVNSLRHAVMLLGHKRLKRWLALLLPTATREPNLRPILFASVRRGFLMEELGRAGGDLEMRSEMFICGVFSLLDRLFQRPIADLLASIQVPERVQQALVDGGGPFAPYMELVNALESGSPFDLRAASDSLMMGLAEVNRALLTALTAAAQLD
ncbi:MAG: HDOD domain-containing protein [Burkholderiales bacterium]|nr:HDOD domain-containing protein [Burkholderiales bacterium]